MENACLGPCVRDQVEAVEVLDPGPAAASCPSTREPAVTSVSCGSAGNCGAGGSYFGASFSVQAFVVSEVNGTWRKAEEVPGTGALNTAGFAILNSVSCPSAGSCGAAGLYSYNVGGNAHHQTAFVVGEAKG